MQICPKCGAHLNSKGICTNFSKCDYVCSSDFDLYSIQNSIVDELRNTLVIVNASIAKMHLSFQPEFFILGGAALAFYGLSDRVTLDIDTANKLDETIRDSVDVFVSDQASEVVKLGSNYNQRAVPYLKELTAIKVYLLAQEDLIITKMITGRAKDIKDLLETDILTQRNIAKATSVLETEYEPNFAKKYIAYLQKLKVRKENYCFD